MHLDLSRAHDANVQILVFGAPSPMPARPIPPVWCRIEFDVCMSDGQHQWSDEIVQYSIGNRNNSAKSLNPRPQGQCVTIWMGKRTRVRFRVPPPRTHKKAGSTCYNRASGFFVFTVVHTELLKSGGNIKGNTLAPMPLTDTAIRAAKPVLRPPAEPSAARWMLACSLAHPIQAYPMQAPPQCFYPRPLFQPGQQPFGEGLGAPVGAP